MRVRQAAGSTTGSTTGSTAGSTTGAGRVVPLARDVALGVVVLAVAAGLLWARLAPPLGVRVVAGGGAVVEGDAGALFARQAVLGVVLAGAGLLLGAAVAARHRRRGALASVLLTVGGSVGAWLALQIGQAAGPAPLGRIEDLPVGTVRQAPLVLDVPGVLLLWPIACLAAVVVLTVLLPAGVATDVPTDGDTAGPG